MADNVVVGHLSGQDTLREPQQMQRPVYLISDQADVSAALSRPENPPTVLADAHELGQLESGDPGLVLLDRASRPDSEVMELAALLAPADPSWVLGIVDAEDRRIRTVGFGRPHAATDVADFASASNDRPGLMLELRGVLTEISRVRHDLNNPLTSALAEVQLLLLDVEDPEVREALEVTQAQLRRMRDMIVDSKHLRLVED